MLWQSSKKMSKQPQGVSERFRKKINASFCGFIRFLRVGERWKKKAKKGLSSVGKLFRIMSRAALCSAELYSTYFLFSKNVDLKTELSFYHCSLHCTKLELCEVALGWFSGICFCF
jgi:hypothetical protein